jgi:hypothetical protein
MAPHQGAVLRPVRLEPKPVIHNIVVKIMCWTDFSSIRMVGASSAATPTPAFPRVTGFTTLAASRPFTAMRWVCDDNYLYISRSIHRIIGIILVLPQSR